MNATENTAPIHRWTRRQYDDMVMAGIFTGEERVELIDGYIIDMSPQSSLHATAVQLVEEALRSAFAGKAYSVRTQLPLALDDLSEPEPDIAVVTGSPRDYKHDHPTTAVLVVEVAGASARQDQGIKKALYARNNIQEYWIVNLDTDRVEVYRQPHGDTYRDCTILRRENSISPLQRAEYTVVAADLLP